MEGLDDEEQEGTKTPDANDGEPELSVEERIKDTRNSMWFLTKANKAKKGDDATGISGIIENLQDELEGLLELQQHSISPKKRLQTANNRMGKLEWKLKKRRAHEVQLVATLEKAKSQLEEEREAIQAIEVELREIGREHKGLLKEILEDGNPSGSEADGEQRATRAIPQALQLPAMLKAAVGGIRLGACVEGDAAVKAIHLYMLRMGVPPTDKASEATPPVPIGLSAPSGGSVDGNLCL
jgi:DNA repair exonuclease SbcCD ATPase subunit